MPGGVREQHIDDSPTSENAAGNLYGAGLAFGTHKRGASSVSLVDPGADFLSCGIHGNTGLFEDADQQLCKNTTQDTSGLITAVTEDEVTATGVTWDVGDEYEIFIGETEDANISSIWTDKSRGIRSDKVQLDRGWRVEDVDLDRDDKHVFGPHQPEKNYNGK